jgi:DNA-binding protein H-NS
VKRLSDVKMLKDKPWLTIIGGLVATVVGAYLTLQQLKLTRATHTTDLREKENAIYQRIIELSDQYISARDEYEKTFDKGVNKKIVALQEHLALQIDDWTTLEDKLAKLESRAPRKIKLGFPVPPSNLRLNGSTGPPKPGSEVVIQFSNDDLDKVLFLYSHLSGKSVHVEAGVGGTITFKAVASPSAILWFLRKLLLENYGIEVHDAPAGTDVHVSWSTDHDQVREETKQSLVKIPAARVIDGTKAEVEKPK